MPDTTSKNKLLKSYKIILIYVMVIFLGILYLFPIYWMIISSLKSNEEIVEWPPTFIPYSFTIEGFKEVIRVFMIERWFINSIFIATTVTVLTLFLTSLAAFAFAYYKFPFKNLLFMYILATLMIPMHIRMIPTFLLIKYLGWLGSYQGIIIPEVATLIALGVFMLRQFYINVPSELIDSARIDGCKEFKIYTYIALPLIKPALIALGVFVFVSSWNNFIWPLLIVQKESMKTLPLGLVGMSDVTLSRLTWAQKMAGATLVTLPILVFYSLFKDILIKGITLTGLKG